MRNMVRPRFVVFCLPLLLGADQGATQAEKEWRSDPVEAALAAPPELGADLLIALAKGSGRARKERIEILGTAFEMASSAKYELRRVGAVGAANNTDSDSGVVVSALGQGLDKLSLRSRVVEELLSLDAGAAKRLFELSQPSRIPALRCEDSLGYSFEDFYKTALSVIRRGYSEKEVAEGKPGLLAESLVRQVASPFQLRGALQILLLGQWKAGDLRSLSSALASMLSQLAADDRSFTAGTHASVLQDLLRLDALLRANDIDPFPLMQAFRGYLLRHLKASRCGDTVDSAAMTRSLDNFNEHLAAKLPNLEAITAEERKPDRILEAKASVYAFWSAPESKRMLMGLRALRFGSAEQIEARKKLNLKRADGMAPYLSDAERSTVAWRVELDAFLKEFHEWESRDDVPALAKFFEKCSILRGLIVLVPDLERKQALLRELLGHVTTAQIRQFDPPVWRLQLDRVLEIDELSEAEQRSLREIAAMSSDVYVKARASRVRPVK